MNSKGRSAISVLDRHILCLLIVGSLLILPSALATPVYNTPVDPAYWSGPAATRSTGSGLVGTGPWGATNPAGFTISWNIVPQTTGYLLYEYTFNWTSKDISHAIIELSDDCLAGAAPCVWGFIPGVDSKDIRLYDPEDPGQSNPNLPASIYGVKVNFGELTSNSATFSFYSDRLPVWGNFYAKDGKDGGVDVTVWNIGLANQGSESIIDFIARPDTAPQYIIPEPGTMALMGLGLLAIGLWRRKR
jgi:hypothetical protein